MSSSVDRQIFFLEKQIEQRKCKNPYAVSNKLHNLKKKQSKVPKSDSFKSGLGYESFLAR